MHRLAAMSYRTITSTTARALLRSPLPSPRILLSPRTACPAIPFTPRRASFVRMASSSSRDIDADHERLAQQEYKKSYTALDEHQRRHVGGKMAAETRARKAGQPSGRATPSKQGGEESVGHPHTPDEEHERLAQSEYGCSYSDLDEHQRRHVGGKMAAETRAARSGGAGGQQASEGQQRDAGGADRQG